MKGPGSTPCKDHFRRMSGTKNSQFEGHLCEIIWRAETKSNIYQSFFQSFNSIYTLSDPPVYTYSTLIFSTWSGLNSTVQLGKWEIKPGKTCSYIFNNEIFTFKNVPQFYFCNFLFRQTYAETDSEAEGERSSSLSSTTEADSISILQTGNFQVVNLQLERNK